MDERRRDAVKAGAGLGIWTMLVAIGLMPSDAARAAVDPASLDSALDALRNAPAAASDAILISVPDVVEDGHSVSLAVTSSIPGTEQIVIVIEENPYKVAASFALSPSVIPEVRTRVKMNRSTTVRALVLAEGKLFSARHEVRVIVGGCGV